MRTCKAAGLLGLLSCGLLFLGVSTCDAKSIQMGGHELYWLYSAGAGAPRWSPDGAYIAFIHDRRATPIEGDGGGLDFLSAIFVVDAAGARLNQVPDGPSAYEWFEADRDPSFSPDGLRVAYETFRYPTGLPWDRTYAYEIATSNLDGTDPKRLTNDGRGNSNPAWSPDGTRIALSTYVDDFTADHQILTMAPDGSDVRSISPVEAGSVHRLVWSPDGRYIALTSTHEWFVETPLVRDGVALAGEYRFDYFIAVASSDGLEYRRIAEFRLRKPDAFRDAFYTRLWGEPVWSPDSTRLAFVKQDSSGTALYTADRDGSNARRVFDNHVDSVAWSSDGAELRFVAPSDVSPNVGAYAVYSAKADAADLRVIAELEPLGGNNRRWPSTNTAWSPDGSRIAVYLGRGDSVLYTMAPDGSDKRVLVSATYGSLTAAAAADGRRDVSSDIAACSEGVIVPDPGKNPALVRDCEILLRIRDKLAGDDVLLNWRATVPITDWEGVWVGSSSRVELLAFTSSSVTVLRGSIPPEIGDLTGLTFLGLNGQFLTGTIPPELGNLSELESLQLDSSQLTGGIPLELGKLTKLESLVLHEDFTGCIPAELISNPNLSISTRRGERHPANELPPC